MQIKELLGSLADENISDEDAEKFVGDLTFTNLEIPSTISVENTLTEINEITKRLYELHNKQKRDPTPLNKIVSLLELKTKLMGMHNIKPEMQGIIDSEINTYKRRFIELAALCMDEITLETLCEKLSREGL